MLYSFVYCLCAGWLQCVPGDSMQAQCTACGCCLQSHMKTLVQHSNSKKHKNNWAANGGKMKISIVKPLHSFENDRVKVAKLALENNHVKVTELALDNDPVKVAELKIAVYIAEHSANSSADHLGKMVPQLDNESDMLRKIAIHRKKCSRLQKYVLGPNFMKLLREDIGDEYFSLIVDECTNEFQVSSLGITIRYFSNSLNKIVDTFYRLVPLVDTKASTVYDTIKKCLNEDNLSLKKLIGIGTDGASALVGSSHSVLSLLKEEIPNITLFKCVCHSLHFAASEASENMPTVLSFIVKETHNWFSDSPLRSNKYQNLYSTLKNAVPRKIPGLSQTRWLADLEAMSVIIDQWDTLQLHFVIAASAERCYIAEQLADAYKNVRNKLYMLHIRKVLKEVSKVNKLYESDNVEVTKITVDLLKMLRSLMQIIVEPSDLSKCSDIDLARYNYQNYFIPLEQVYFGHDFHTLLAYSSLTEDQAMFIKERCRNFVVELVSRIQMRIPDNLNTLLMLNLFDPRNATSQSNARPTDFAVKYIDLVEDIDEFETEWSRISLEKWPEECFGSVHSFWTYVSKALDSGGNKLFPRTSSLALALLSLPFSNASVECIFSQMNVVQNKLRKSLHVPNVEAIFHIRYGLKRQSLTCVQFQPTANLLENFFAGSTDVNDDPIISMEA